MHNESINWQDLQYVLRVAQTGSIAAAAEALGVNRTTVLRRINQFEQTLDFRLFDRPGNTYVLAPGAEQLLASAIDVENSVDEIFRQVQGKTLQLEGEILVTTTDSILLSQLAPHLQSFQRIHPQIRVELRVSSYQMSLSRREADVAIRPGKTMPKELVARRLQKMEFGIFASPEYIEGNSSESIADHRWLGVEPPISASPPGVWLTDNIPAGNICLTADSFVALRCAAENHMGLTILPVELGEQSAGLRRVFRELPLVNNTLWIVTHPDIVRSTRVHRFIEHMCNAFAGSTL